MKSTKPNQPHVASPVRLWEEHLGWLEGASVDANTITLKLPPGVTPAGVAIGDVFLICRMGNAKQSETT